MQSVCVELSRIGGPEREESTLVGMTFGGFLHSKVWSSIQMASNDSSSLTLFVLISFLSDS